VTSLTKDPDGAAEAFGVKEGRALYSRHPFFTHYEHESASRLIFVTV